MSVVQASRAFGSEVRLRLIRHFIEHPNDSKVGACEALGIANSTTTENMRVLVDVGVIKEEPTADRRTRVYRVDLARYDELLDVLRAYAHHG